MELIKDTHTTGEDMMITGFGKFCVNKEMKKNRNPFTDQDMTLREGLLRGRMDEWGRKI